MSKVYYNSEPEMLACKAWDTLKLSAPVDLYRVAEALKIEVCEREFDESIDGIYVRMPDGFARIGINNIYTKPQARRRFTLAHEIGHHLLSRSINPGKRIFFVDGTKSAGGMMERACNQFAVNLLMPANLLIQHFDELSHNPENRLQIIAERFGVSNWALRRRLRELGIQTFPYARPNRHR